MKLKKVYDTLCYTCNFEIVVCRIRAQVSLTSNISFPKQLYSSDMKILKGIVKYSIKNIIKSVPLIVTWRF